MTNGNTFKEKYLVEEEKEEKEKTAYNQYVESQEELFMLNFKGIINKVRELQSQGKLSEFIQINARIKSFESSYTNTSKKALDDIFGITILAANKQEVNDINDILNKYYNVPKTKKHNKDNGYRAVHCVGAMNEKTMEKLQIENRENCPVIEFQLKTIAVAVEEGKIGSDCEHSNYKGINKEAIQKKYDENKFSEKDLPRMFSWNSNEKGYKELTKEQILRKLYPWLRMECKTIEVENVP